MKTKLAAMIFVRTKTNKCLVIKRSEDDTTYAGYYSLVGGGVEDGEDFLTGAIREFEEEAGYDISENIIELKVSTIHQFPFRKRRIILQFYTVLIDDEFEIKVQKKEK